MSEPLWQDKSMKTYSKKLKNVDYVPVDEIDEILSSPVKERMVAKALAIEKEENRDKDEDKDEEVSKVKCKGREEQEDDEDDEERARKKKKEKDRKKERKKEKEKQREEEEAAAKEKEQEREEDEEEEEENEQKRREEARLKKREEERQKRREEDRHKRREEDRHKRRDEEEEEEEEEAHVSDKEIQKALRCLKIGRMLNDTVVDFYMSHIASTLPRCKVHVFSTFLYRKLKNLVIENAGDAGRAVKQMRWDKKVKIFEKEFLVIPVCDHAHWVLVIVCFAYERPKSEVSPPCLLIFDSLGYKHPPSFSMPIRQFLQQRWITDRPGGGRRDFLDRDELKEFHALVPRQNNCYDCGVHLLHNFERFLQMPRVTFWHVLRSEVLNFSFNTTDKRSEIRKALLESVRTSIPEEWTKKKKFK